MDIISAYREVGTFRGAAAISGTTAKTVKRVIERHEAGGGASVRLNDGRCATLRPENIPAFARAYLGGSSPRTPYASPLFGDLDRLPRVLLQVASTELLLDDARQVHDKIQSTGGASRLEIFDGVFHAWQMLDGLMPEARVALRQAAAFVNEPAKAVQHHA